MGKVRDCVGGDGGLEGDTSSSKVGDSGGAGISTVNSGEILESSG